MLDATEPLFFERNHELAVARRVVEGDRLLRSGSEQYGAGPAIHLPIFESGRLEARFGSSKAELEAAASANGSSSPPIMRQ